MNARMCVILTNTASGHSSEWMHYDVQLFHKPSPGDIMKLKGERFKVKNVTFNLDHKFLEINLEDHLIATFKDFEKEVEEFKKNGWCLI